MTRSRTLRLPTFVRELLAVILGILLALAGDAWWEDRQEARRGLELRDAIRNELLADSVMRNGMITDTERGFGAMQRLLAQIHGPDPDADSVLTHMGNVMGLTAQADGLETYRAAVSSGDVRLLRDPELERALSIYDEVVGVLSRNNDFFLETVTTGEFGRGLARHGGLIQIMGRSPRYERSLDEALADPGFRGGLEMLSYVWQNRSAQSQGLQQAADSLLAVLDRRAR